MADDQVKYSDLFESGIVEEINNMKTALQGVVAEITKAKTEANGFRGAMSGMGTATREQQQSVAADAAAIDALNKKVKQLADEETRLNAAIKKAQDEYNKLTEGKLRYKKLTMDEVAAVEKLRQALKGEAAEQMAAVQSIDMQSKSYNELYQTYNALKEALNKMTVAERENTEAGKMMVNRAKEIRDTLNNLQQQTGNYALNVGNYMSAMNGLQFQAQQLIREIPSAINLQQFFLAISNNIPMFAEALARYNKGLPEIKAKLASVTAEIAKQNAQLATMNVQSAEYAAKQAQINELQRQQNQLQGASVSGWKAIVKAVGSWQTLLIAGLLLLRKLPDILKKIKSAGNEVLEFQEKATEGAAGLVREYQDLVREWNALGDDQSKRAKWIDEHKKKFDELGISIGNVNEADRKFSQEGTEEYIRAVKRRAIADAYKDKLAQAAIRKQNAEDRMREMEKNGTATTVVTTPSPTGKTYYNARTGSYYTTEPDVQHTVKTRGYAEAEKEYNAALKETLDIEQKIKDFEDGFRAGGGGGNGDDKPPKDPVKDILTLQRMLEDAQTANIEDEYRRAVETEEKRHERFVQDRQAELELLKEDDPRRKVINKQIEEEDKTHYMNRRKLRSDHMEKMRQLWDKNAKEAEQAAKDGAKAELKAAVDGWAEYKAKMVEEGKTRKQIVEAEVAAEIARLNLMLKLNRDINGEKMSDEQRQKVEEWINLLERLQQTGNYGDYKPGQFMGKGGANVTNERKNYANIWEVLGIDMDNNQVSALNSVFDQAKEALNSWMDARKAAADQAKELADDEVSAAENALNREIELRNQGYANDVALREKELADAKAAQKKAAEEQKKVAQEQVLLDAALQTSSMITASANIIKQFPNPLAWAPMLALMWGTFAYAKTKAYQASTKSIKFKEGGVMLLEGGSHESGHDVNLGIGPDGSNLRAEGGEYFAVINKRSSRKYGSQIPAVVNALNSGMFEDRYIKTSDAMGLMGNVGVVGNVGESADLSRLESGVGELVKQGEQNWTIEGDYRVLRYKNLTRRVKIG